MAKKVNNKVQKKKTTVSKSKSTSPVTKVANSEQVQQELAKGIAKLANKN